MLYYFAPLEGITGYLYRNTHHRFFPGTDKYFMPFAAPNYTRNFKRKEKADMAPENNAGIPVVPQILSNNAQETLWAVDEIRALGYREINLNLGCPMPTVARKKKGSGFLKFTSELDAYLDEVYEGMSHRDCLLSVKTRLGTDSIDEAEGLIRVYSRYPISELIIHPRCQRDLYRGRADQGKFEEVLQILENVHALQNLENAQAHSGRKCSVVYNGDLCTPSDVLQVESRWDQRISSVMIGRGLLADPSLVRQCQGGAPISSRELAAFHEALYAGYDEILPSTTVLLNHMKELWFYMGKLFTGGTGDAEKLLKQIRKSSTKPQYEAAVRVLLNNCALKTEIN